MDLENISSVYQVAAIEEKNLGDVYALCKTNPKFYVHMEETVTVDSLREAMKALPPGKGFADKAFVGFYHGTDLAAILDLIRAYPDEKTAFIGLFMVDKLLQGKGVGSRLVDEIAEYVKARGFTRMRLAYIKGNEESRTFWIKNHFVPTGEEKTTDIYTMVVMQREL